MKLFLTVPRQSAQTGPDAVTSPVRTRESIAKLPVLNTRESLQQVHESLYGLNRAQVRVSQRLKLLDMHRSPLRVIRGQVESQFSKGAIPLSQSDLLVAGLFRDCCVEMAFGYKIIVLEVAQSRKRSQLEEIKLSMARALYYLEQTIFACALFRQSPPEGIWQEVHTIHDYACKLGVDEDPLKDTVTKVRTSTSISLTYRRILLFGLSDPFHQSVPLMVRVLEFLRRHAADAEIKRYARSLKGDCQFVIDPQSDYPARPHRQKQELPKNALVLDTVALTRNARALLKRLESAERADIDLGDEFQDEIGGKLLDEVVHKWGLSPTREEERIEEDHGRVEMMVGVEAANYCINEEKPFVLSTLDHVEDNAVIGKTSQHELRPRQSRLKKLECAVLDRGESGFRLQIPYTAADPGTLRVGDLISCREDGESWKLGLIRWIRCVDDSIQFGVKKLSRQARPIAVKPVSTKPDEPFKAGLAVDIDTATLQLVTLPGLYRDQRNLFVDDGDSLLMTRAQRLIESSQTMEWYECETLNL